MKSLTGFTLAPHRATGEPVTWSSNVIAGLTYPDRANYGNGLWALPRATDVSPQVWTATNPTGTWTGASTPPSSGVFGAAYDGTGWAVGGYRTKGSFYASDPTGTWTENDTGFPYSPNSSMRLRYGGGYYLITDGSAGTHTEVVYKVNYNDNWSWSDIGGTRGLTNVTDYGGGYFFGCTNTQKLRYNSTITGTWAETSQVFPDKGLAQSTRSAAYGNGYWVTVGDRGSLGYTTDITGAWSYILDLFPSNPNIYDVFYGAGGWVVSGPDGKIATTDGDPSSGWTIRTLAGAGIAMSTVNYANGYWVVSEYSNAGRIWTATPGV